MIRVGRTWMSLRLGLLLLALLLTPLTATAALQPVGEGRVNLSDPSVVGTFVVLVLENGDRLSGTVIEVSDGNVRIEHIILGEVVIPRQRVTQALTNEPLAQQAPLDREAERRGEVEPEPVPPTTEPTPIIETPEPTRATWDREVELGLTGSSGNTERRNLLFGFRVERNHEESLFRLNARYRLDTDRGNRTANRFLANARQEWGRTNERLSLFLQGGVELDEFRDFEYRITGGAGVTYPFIFNERTSLRGRLGAGFNREAGGGTRDWIPELITGLELDHRINDTQRLVASAEVFPDLEELGEFRSILRGEWRLQVARDPRISLRIGLEHRYETQTIDAKRSDFDFFLRMVYGF